MISNKPRSRIPIRPHTVTGSQNDEEKKEVEIQFTNQSMTESATDVNDAFATGDGQLEEIEPEIPKKVPLFKQSMINCSLVETRKAPVVPQKKYVPNYQKELGRLKKRISIPDELKSIGDESFPECGLAEKIAEDLKKQLEELKKDSEENQSEIPPENNRFSDIEARLSFLEQKLETLIELLHESQIIKKREFAIKIEEYNLEKLNSQLRVHETIIPRAKSSDPTLHQEIMYETRQKRMNMSLGDKESLRFNKISALERAGLVFEPQENNSRKYMSILKQIGKLNK